MRVVLVVLGIAALPAWAFWIVVVQAPAVGFFIAPAVVPALYALIVLLLSPRVALATFLVSFGLSTLVVTLGTLALVDDVMDTVATPQATR
jgi:hypothetical protein